MHSKQEIEMDVKKYLESKGDAELLVDLEQAKADLAAAAKDDYESPWHEACFAGVVMLCHEATRRGILPIVR